MIKGSSHQEDIAVINIYALNIKTPKYMMQTFIVLKEEIDSSTIVVDFSFLLSTLPVIDRTTRQKINKEIEDLNNIMDQLELINIYRLFHPAIAEFTCFSN